MPTSICAYIGACLVSKPRALNWFTMMCSTWLAASLISDANEPVDEATGESRTRMRKPSDDCST